MALDPKQIAEWARVVEEAQPTEDDLTWPEMAGSAVAVHAMEAIPALIAEVERLAGAIARDVDCDACTGKAHDTLGGQYLDGEDSEDEGTVTVTIDGHWQLCKPHRERLRALLPRDR
jgi:hypothetical protein